MAWRPALVRYCNAGYIEAKAVYQLPAFEAAMQFARTEGIIPAPETAHAIRAAIDEALDAKEKGEKRVILFNLSGHGNFDMSAYQAYLSGQLQDYEYPIEAIKEAMERPTQSSGREMTPYSLSKKNMTLKD